jgi:hypothetical protein
LLSTRAAKLSDDAARSRFADDRVSGADELTIVSDVTLTTRRPLHWFEQALSKDRAIRKADYFCCKNNAMRRVTGLRGNPNRAFPAARRQDLPAIRGRRTIASPEYELYEREARNVASNRPFAPSGRARRLGACAAAAFAE